MKCLILLSQGGFDLLNSFFLGRKCIKPGKLGRLLFLGDDSNILQITFFKEEKGAEET